MRNYFNGRERFAKIFHVHFPYLVTAIIVKWQHRSLMENCFLNFDLFFSQIEQQTCLRFKIQQT
jgi:hypothetical protein